MIKAVIFDCFGVLTIDTWREFVASLPSDERGQASELNRAFGAGFVTKKDFQEEIQLLTGRQPTDIDNTKHDHQVTKNTALLKYIASIKNDYKIGLLSNVASDWIKENFLSDDEQKLFDDFIFSHQVKMTKPEPQIFSLAAERLGVLPEECVLVDDIERYCRAAEAQGMKAVCYKDFGQTKNELQQLLT